MSSMALTSIADFTPQDKRSVFRFESSFCSPDNTAALPHSLISRSQV